MRLKVQHSTIYDYDQPMRFVTQSHRLTPTSHGGQTVTAWEVASEGAEFGAEFTDGAGNRVTTMTVNGPVQRVEISVTGEVETIDTAGVLRGHREIISPRCYLRATPLTRLGSAHHEIVHDMLARLRSEEDLARAHALSELVAKTVQYRPGTTGSQTTATQAVEAGEGVCQDHAHVLIAFAHLAGLSARYVTGYLLVDPQPVQSQSRGDDAQGQSQGAQGGESVGEASHAWAEIYIRDLGWVGFDPSNETCPDERFIRLGSGLDAVDAAPIRGVSRGGGLEAMDYTVAVSVQ